MDYRQKLEIPLSKLYIDSIVEMVCNNPSDFEELYQLIFDNDIKVAWRAAWACQKICAKHPNWFSGEKATEIINFSMKTKHDGVLRGCLSMIYCFDLSSEISVEFINACFDWMISTKSPIAVQAYSMKILHKICVLIPDFKPELIATLENIDTNYYSVGFNTIRKNTLKALNK